MLWVLTGICGISFGLNIYLFRRLRDSRRIINNVIHSTGILMEMAESVSSQIVELKETQPLEDDNGDV